MIPSSPREPLLRPIARLTSPALRLYLTAFSLLFTELVLIRWIPAEITYVGFFSNFLLIGSFLGIGIGILAGRRFTGTGARALPIGLFIPLLFITVRFVTIVQLNVQVRAADEVFFGLAENRSAADINFVVLPLAVGLATLLMAVLALPLGPLLRAMSPLRAYSIDIVGSLSGIAAFTLLSALSTTPAAWFAVLGLILLCLALGRGINAWGAFSAALMGGVILISLAPVVHGMSEYWSPYYRITLLRGGEADYGVQYLNVNGIPHQVVWDAGDPRKEPFYEQVYRWFPDRTFENVLIVGAGNGVDAATALAHGAVHVDAVEIDPKIAEIGRVENHQRPYSDSRVDLHINDGRNFLSTTSTKYDLVVFALPDSLTLVSSVANVRLETFLFTSEAFSSVRDHLTETGVFVLYNYYRQPWLIQRLAGMLAGTFGSAPIVRTYENVAATLAAGPAVQAALTAGTIADLPIALPPDPEYRPATDDWPFLYLREPSIAPYYLVALALILLLGSAVIAGVARATRTPFRRFSPHFFVLGAAFLLIETRSVVTFSLLFGSTWLVNALVFFAILLSVLAAIQLNARLRFTRMAPIYILLTATLAINAVLPPETLLVGAPVLRYIAASLLAFVPVFCANLVFTRSFRDTKTADMSFASNLLGAVLGGGLEYLSLLFGYSALNLVAIVLYALAWLLMTKARVFADVDLG
jgi:hypothetical protein